MTRSEAAGVLLVRAIEESRPDAIPPEVLIDALGAAGDMDDEAGWLSRRASFLLDHALAPYRLLLSMSAAPFRGVVLLIAGAFLAGVMSNYLGPSARIHVLFNPIALLILWNLAVFAALAVHRLVPRPSRSDEPGDPAGPPPRGMPATSAARPTEAPRAGLLATVVLGRVAPALWLRLHRAAEEGAARASDIAHVARAFWRHWIAIARPSLVLALRRALHCAAIGIGLGAVLGMYARGLFFEYNAVWRSTFVTDPGIVLTALRWALGPAAWLLGRPLPDAAQVALLTSTRGAPAAPWIHLYAASAMIFIVVPRLLLALHASVRLRGAARDVRLDLSEPYYAEMLAAAHRLQVARVAERINMDVRVECGKFAEGLATFVCDQLYDARIAPAVRGFREEGGKLSELEDRIRDECRLFEEELARHIPGAQEDFERSLARSIERTVGATLSVETIAREGLAGRLGTASEASADAMGSSLGAGLADVVSAGVSAAAGLVAGTVSGGFGKALGVALLVSVVHSGPVAWVIGALGGLVVAGAGWWMGREKLTGSIRRIRLPAAVVKATLWQGRLERIIAEGRIRCQASVTELLESELAPLTPRLAEQIWTRVKPILGEAQKRRTRHE